jgi:hypothetical protein
MQALKTGIKSHFTGLPTLNPRNKMNLFLKVTVRAENSGDLHQFSMMEVTQPLM